MSESIDNVFGDHRVFEVPAAAGHRPNCAGPEEYRRLYQASIQDPEGFWAGIAEGFTWFRKWDRVLRYRWDDKIEVAWFEGSQTNLSVNCLDRQLETRGEKTALLWEGNEPGEVRKFSYRELHREVCRLANALKALGVRRGDRVAVYMGMVPELAMALLACARIGAIHNVVFGGFSVESLKDRILDCRAEFLITADGLFRGEKQVALKANADQALAACEAEGHRLVASLVLKRTGQPVAMVEGRDYWWEELVPLQEDACPAEAMEAEDALFILYTSGSTGKPKGVLHTTAGYMVQAATTFKYVFDYREDDVFWCTADIGWVTGHSYLVYGPLLNGATTVMFEGIPTYPGVDRFWEMIDRHQVSIFYTAPTAIRSLMRSGEAPVAKHSLKSLRVLGSVGEPINPEAWVWYFNTVGKGRCPIVDTWWQTETGAIMVSPLAFAMPLKPGSAAMPFFGVKPKILRENGFECGPNEGGLFVIEAPWPAMIRGVYGQPDRVKQTYFSKFPGKYFAGDGARCDPDGYYWFLGRMDDVLKVSGHRLGTAELESAFVKNPAVAETAVVGFPHDLKGEGIYAFITLKEGVHPSRSLRRELIQHIASEVGPIAKPDHIQFAPALPKTRSGKIMRRVLRKIAAGDTENLGDTSTLADPGVVKELLEGAMAQRDEDHS
ncbi:MAG: acetate--CoA ligase [bacterium]